MIINGYNGGAWTGAGITSSTAASLASATHKTGLGYAEASTLGYSTFAGFSVDSTTVLVKYTWYGDANLDGRVNAMDLNIVTTNYAPSGKLWSDGDFDYDGDVDYGGDYTTASGSFNQSQL